MAEEHSLVPVIAVCPPPIHMCVLAEAISQKLANEAICTKTLLGLFLYTQTTV